jgi:cellulose synthase/poly-beta-1,6-N-acetylglucosamine synthase-like glycosyltransferase/peptidoglycan/xylan/chitin deacetylase (PgdA/CDA1 family)/spore germination protein YaaH
MNNTKVNPEDAAAAPTHGSAVFFDPTRRRWRLTKGVFVLFALGLLGLIVALVWGVTSAPRLPSLTLPQAAHPGWRGHGFKFSSNTPKAHAVALSSHAALPAGTAKVNAHRVMGFFVNWDDNSFTSLKTNLGQIDTLMPEWLHLLPDGGVKPDDLFKQERARTYIRTHRPELPIDVLVNNYSADLQDWDGAGLARMLHSSDARAKTIVGLQNFIAQFDLQGVNIDFESVPDRAQADLVTFMRELHAAFKPLHLEVTQSLPLDDDTFDYRALAEHNDALVLMGYDEHEESSAPGAVASQAWLEANLRSRVAQLGTNKVILALGNYGYDWTRGQRGATELSFQDAQATARDSDGEISLGDTLNPHFRYDDDNGRTHEVWYLDAVSAYDQTLAAARMGVGSYALWRMGQEDPSVWRVLNRRASLDSSSFGTVHYGYDLDYQGTGELLKVASTAHDGARTVTRDPSSGLFTTETMHAFAAPLTIQRWGGTDAKRIALTFDDGPDPAYTPQILDILEREHVPATFFVIGANIATNSDLMRRVIKDGFEVGSHTFTHPNLSTVSPEQFDLELNATQRLLESQFGVSTLLFRPPYAEDVEPETPDQAGALIRAGQLGYYTVGMQIDPLDWHSHDAKQITERVLEGATAHQGNIVLLHDAGGDRSATVAALPGIIHALRAKGYTLVGVSNLIGVPKAKVMPVVDSARLLNGASDAGFTTLEVAAQGLGWLFVGGIALSVARLLFIAFLALLEARRPARIPDGPLPSLSVIVPAYNEVKVINKTVQSLLQSAAVTEIIVVDDGSKDGTADAVREAYGNNPRVRVFSLENGGKSRALNFGIAHANSEIVLLLDADTILNADAPALLARHFTDPKIAAVAGNAKVGNRVNLMTRWQALEYITAQNLERRALAHLGCITVVPGAIGAWRRTTVLEAGGFQTDTLAEDADLTMRLLRMGYTITYEPKAIALTEAPDTVGGFLKQRFRWMFGTLQAAFKQRDVVLRPRHGSLGLFAMPNVFIFQILFPFVSSLMDIALIAQIAWVLLQTHFHPATDPLSGISHSLWFYALFMCVDALAATIAFALEHDEDWSLLPWLLLQRFFYRQLMYSVAIKAAVAALRGTAVGWGKLERKASVPLNIPAPTPASSGD